MMSLPGRFKIVYERLNITRNFASRSVLNNPISWVTEPTMSTSPENANLGCYSLILVKYFIRCKQTLNLVLNLGLFDLLTFFTPSNCLLTVLDI